MAKKPTYKELEQRVRELEEEYSKRKRAEEALQESETSYRDLAESLNELVYRADPNTFEPTYVNSSVLGLYGYAVEEWLKEPTLWESTIHPDDKERVLQELADAKTNIENRDCVYRIIRKDRTVRWVEDHVSFQKDQQGRLVSLNGVMYDITQRKRAEEDLQRAHEELELRVEERTADLVRSKKQLEEVNTALRVLVNKRDEDKTELEGKVLSNVEELVLPYLDKLRKTSLDSSQTSCLDILESNLNDVISPFSRKLSSKYLGLTPTEVRVANLVRNDKTTKEIAELINSSIKTVEFHRDNIRKKLGIKYKKTNLRTHLLSM